MIMKEELKLKRLTNKKIKACDISQDNGVFGFQVQGYTVLQDCQTNTLIQVFKNSLIFYYGCKFSENNQWFVFFDAKQIHIYNLHTNKLLQIASELHPNQLIMNNIFVICQGNSGYLIIELGSFINHYIKQSTFTKICTNTSKPDIFISYGHIQYFQSPLIEQTIRIVYWHCRREKWLKYFVIPHYRGNFKLHWTIAKNFVATYFFSDYGNFKVSVYNHHTQKLLFSIYGYIVASLVFSPCEKYLILKTYQYVILDLSNRNIKTIPIKKGRFTFFTNHNQSIIETNSRDIRVLKLYLE